MLSVGLRSCREVGKARSGALGIEVYKGRVFSGTWFCLYLVNYIVGRKALPCFRLPSEEPPLQSSLTDRSRVPRRTELSRSACRLPCCVSSRSPSYAVTEAIESPKADTFSTHGTAQFRGNPRSRSISPYPPPKPNISLARRLLGSPDGSHSSIKMLPANLRIQYRYSPIRTAHCRTFGPGSLVLNPSISAFSSTTVESFRLPEWVSFTRES